MLSIIIPTYNRPELLDRCLKSLSLQPLTSGDFEIIVVDDGSDKSAKDLVESNHKNVRYFYKEHEGISSARNFGIKNSRGEIIAFIDDDCEVPQGWVESVIHYHKIYPGAPAIQGRIDNFFKGNIWSEAMQCSFDAIWHQKTKENFIGLIATGNISFKKNLFEKIGYFDENLPRCEDFDLAYRMNRAGEKILYEERIIVYHHHRLTLNDFIKQQFASGRSRFLLDSKWKKVPGIFANKRRGFWIGVFRKASFKAIAVLFAVIVRKIFFLTGYIYERYFCFHSNSDSK